MTAEVRRARVALALARTRVATAAVADLRRDGVGSRTAKTEARNALSLIPAAEAASEGLKAAAESARNAADTALQAAQTTLDNAAMSLESQQAAVQNARNVFQTAINATLAAPDVSLTASIVTYNAARAVLNTALNTLQSRLDNALMLGGALGEARVLLSRAQYLVEEQNGAIQSILRIETESSSLLSRLG